MKRPAGRFVLAGLLLCGLAGCGEPERRISAAVEVKKPTPRSASVAEPLLRAMAEARADGLDPERYGVPAIRAALARDPMRGQAMLVESFGRYANDLTTPSARVRIHHVDAAPRFLSPAARWTEAQAAPSLAAYVDRLRAGNPVASRLRAAVPDRARFAADLDTLRAIPANPGRRFVLVETATQRLWMFEAGRPVGSMRVVVGKSDMATPMMTAAIRFASLNPYWHVPIDLVRARARAHILPEGAAYFRRARLEPVDGYDGRGRIVDPQAIDWRAVADGRAEIGLRQLPGPGNMMGRVKFMFPNRLGIYLHDTPDRRLFTRADRRFSSGCVRLEDAPGFYAWLFGRPLPAPDPARPEQQVALAEPVPVYILHLPVAARHLDALRPGT